MMVGSSIFEGNERGFSLESRKNEKSYEDISWQTMEVYKEVVLHCFE